MADRTLLGVRILNQGASRALDLSFSEVDLWRVVEAQQASSAEAFRATAATTRLARRSAVVLIEGELVRVNVQDLDCVASHDAETLNTLVVAELAALVPEPLPKLWDAKVGSDLRDVSVR